MKELVIFDVDGVIIRGQSQQLFLKYLLRKKVISLTYYINLIAWFMFYKMGFVKNPTSAMEFAYRVLRGKSEEYLSELTKDFFSSDLINHFYGESRELIQKHRENGSRIVLLSNAIGPIIKEVASYLKVEDFIATRLESNQGIFTGKILGSPVFGKNKVEKIKNYIKFNKLEGYKTTGYGDHITDLDILNYVNEPVAVNPSPELLKIAGKNSWKVLKFN